MDYSNPQKSMRQIYEFLAFYDNAFLEFRVCFNTLQCPERNTQKNSHQDRNLNKSCSTNIIINLKCFALCETSIYFIDYLLAFHLVTF